MKNNEVLILQHSDITQLAITPAQCIEWVEKSFCMKSQSQLKPKISLHPQGDDFFNTMPCLLPTEYGRFSVKEVHRIAGAEPSLGSDLLLYDSRTGQLLSIMDADWITAMRTGAVVALAVRMFQKENANEYAFLGLGNTARAVALCLLAELDGKPAKFRLLRYKNQAEDFINRFGKDAPNVEFEILDDASELIEKSQVIISCVTSAGDLFCADDSKFQEGTLVIPVHTRGFQNCDLFFDKVFGDDTGHVEGFKYFSQFKSFAEISDVLLGNTPGRENSFERILVYAIGLGLHDALFASNIYDLYKSSVNQTAKTFIQEKVEQKFWI